MLRRIVYFGYADWGNAIHYTDVSHTKIYGWKPYDLWSNETCMVDLINNVNNKYSPVYLLKNVSWQHDPEDMFFADIEKIGEIPTEIAKIGGNRVEKEVLNVYELYKSENDIFIRIRKCFSRAMELWTTKSEK